MNSLNSTPYDKKNDFIIHARNKRGQKNSSLNTFREKEKRRDIDHKNKLLLGKLLTIERDFDKNLKQKRIIKKA